MKKIYYYFPVEGKKSKSGTAILTIDWFKKKFRLPLNLEDFVELNYEELTHDIPNLKDIIAFTNETLIWQGQVEGIIRQKTMSEEIVRVLLQPLK